MSSTFKLALVPALYALVLLCACSPNAIDDPQPSKPAITADNYEQKFTDATCSVILRCQPGFVTSLEQCRALMSAGGSNTTFNSASAVAASVRAGKIILDSAKAQTCIDAINALPCDQLANTQIDDMSACKDMLKGTVAVGASCNADQACVDGAFCLEAQATGDASCAATCQQKGVKCREDADCAADKVCESNGCVAMDVPAGANGQPCGTHQRCQAGLTCIYTAGDEGAPGTSSCQPLMDEGGACSGDNDCKTGLRCVLHQEDPQGQCAKPTPPAAAGQACTLDGTVMCQPGLVCSPSADFTSATCVAQKKKGEACATEFECGFIGALTCDPLLKVCVDKPTSGVCLTPFSCAPDKAYCDMSASVPVCKLFKQEGAQCSDDAECGPIFGPVRCDGALEGSKGVCKKVTPLVCQP